MEENKNVFFTSSGEAVHAAPLPSTSSNYLVYNLGLRYIDTTYSKLVASCETVEGSFDEVQEVSYIGYRKEKKSFIWEAGVHKSKTLDYYVIIDPVINFSYDEDQDKEIDGLVMLTGFAFDPSDHEMSKKVAEDLNKHFYLYDDYSSKIFVVLKNPAGFTFQASKIKPLPINLELMYNDDFEEVHYHIEETLASSHKGVVLLHGAAGTGKTNYIKHLTTLIPDKRFVFIPVSMVPYLTDPSFLSALIEHKGSILVLEDSETFLRDRASGENGVVSTILNLADGMLSDVLGIQIICTFNSDLSKVDEALLRKGRLIAEYEFGPLDVEKAKDLAESLGTDAELVKGSMTLAEVTNLKDKMPTSASKNKGGKIGFR